MKKDFEIDLTPGIYDVMFFIQDSGDPVGLQYCIIMDYILQLINK